MKRELAIAAALFAIASVILTLPLAQHPTRTLPSDLQDTLLNTWIIAWDADRLRHGLRGVWDAPIFFPYHTTRWIGVQDGSSSISVELKRPWSVARLQLGLAARSLTDYPRELQIESVDARRQSRTLYHAIPYPELLEAFVRDPAYPVMTIELPANETATLVIREVGTQPNWWSVHELALWRRRWR
jgi:hypothetical protein